MVLSSTGGVTASLSNDSIPYSCITITNKANKKLKKSSEKIFYSINEQTEIIFELSFYKIFSSFSLFMPNTAAY